MKQMLHSEDRKAIEKLIDYMHEHPQECFDISKHALMIGFSVSKLNKSFKVLIGIGPASYFRRIKMQKAKELHIQQSYTWTEISSLFGYSDLASFSKAFKRIHGFCPRNATSSDYLTS
ncbi:helix-turn-helix domain-containing protein [Fluviicola taffensis]|uniref:Helix-turn-helix, AraC domain protein n=1 Tax=Fluviicola taffensis (strain DSM 16823 / NCIMB 13979 / RW262) TaxID=755732 RepID=F2IDX3_FLUTR|nr:AraC family transcriptional regulator [Fluviicola taffensis]AEA44515.1 Helix-turn-helix, AraC domain protein [Fluviicola taffensis DSM 16823]